MNKELLNITNMLLTEKMNAKIVKGSDLIKYEHIELGLGNDYKDRPISAYIWLDQQQTQSEENSDNQRMFLQILVVFPFQFKEEVVSQLGRYILVINKSLAFPGFGISEPDRSIYYKYTLTFPDGKISKSLLLDFIGLIWLIFDSFIEKIESVSNKNKTLFEIVS